MSDSPKPSNESEAALRELVSRLVGWSEAHVSLEEAVRGLPPEMRTVRPAGISHSVWDLVEHIRIAQRDILEFCGDDSYQTREWPHDYWPDSTEKVDERLWTRTLEAIREDRESLRSLVTDPARPLLQPVPHGEGNQTLLREVFLVADHTAYHVGQIVMVRRALGCWPGRR